MPGTAHAPDPPDGGVSDRDLVLAARDGVETACAMLFDRHRKLVYGLSFRLLGKTDEAQDVVQDVFVQALESLHTVQQPDAFSAWLASIVVNLVGKHLRRRRLFERLGLRRYEPVSAERMIAATCPPDVAAELRAVYGIIDVLPVETRLVLLLRRVEGLTIEETAAHLKRSIATVKRRLAEADECLRTTNAGGPA